VNSVTKGEKMLHREFSVGVCDKLPGPWTYVNNILTI